MKRWSRKARLRLRQKRRYLVKGLDVPPLVAGQEPDYDHLYRVTQELHLGQYGW